MHSAKLLLPLLAAGMTLVSHQATAQTTIAKWTFETLSSSLSYVPGAGVSTTNFYADQGLQAGVAAITGKHFGFGTASTTYSSPAGNGSSRAFSSNGWTNNPGDYYQIAVNTSGFTNISLSFEQFGSGTGPKDFQVFYSTDGINFTPFTTYVVPSTAPWVSNSIDFSTVTTLANAPTVYFRLVDNSNASANGTGLVGTGGTSRIDNVVVAGLIAGPPQIISYPANTIAYYGDTISLSVISGGDAPLTYQWYTNSPTLTALVDGSSGFGSGTISGTASSTVTFSLLSTNQTGDYRVVVANSLGSATSAVVHLQVNVRTPIVTNITYLRKLHDANFALTDTTNIYVVEGIVTTPINLVSGSTEVDSFFIQDTNGVGCDVFFRGGFPFPAQGDKVRITAPLLQYQGLLELNPINGNPAHSVEILSSGNPLPAPGYYNISTPPTATEMEELIEGKYMIVSNVFIGVSAASSGRFTAGGTIYMTNQFGKIFYGQVPNNTLIDIVGYGLPGTFAKSLRGVISQAQTSGTVLTNLYSILLAQGADLEIGSPVTANADSYTVTPNSTSTFLPLTNDVVFSPDTTPRILTVTAVNATNGTATIQNGTDIVFTPNQDYLGTLTIDYTATDNYGYQSNGVIYVTVANTVTPTPIPLNIGTISGSLVLSWTNSVFQLQSSTNVAGPYTDISGATSPYTNTETSPTLFFRLKY